ncbi:aminotransferase class I/II-fold pyridoxal phosphate-dependent enzyme [Candidatus Parcubacteria bacterium]|nr:aminotransferase class I/II-fold pyridoxal phosphate-dependent enzyme [Candidatus Parcubacteria bacterium]
MFERTKNLRLSIIKQIELKASVFPDAISLAQGVPSFDTPVCVKRRVERALRRGVVAKYSLSPGLPELRELIEIQLEKENMFYDWEKEIIVTAGTIEGITASILAITAPGDEIIIPEPTYTSYREVIYLAGCKPVFVPLNEKKGWAFGLNEYEKAITDRTKAIFFCNPNNPTGTIYSKEQQLGLAGLAKKYNLFIITDEVYKDFVYNNEQIFSLAEIPDLREQVIRIYGFSKAYAMTGWRVGYVHSDEKIIREIVKVHDALVTCAPVISQYAAMGALEMGEGDVENFNKNYKKRRALICARLDNLKNIFSYVYPQSAYYVFPKIKINIKNAWDFSLELLDKTHVAVVPGSAFGNNGEAHIRLSFGRSEEDINTAFDRFDDYFKNA